MAQSNENNQNRDFLLHSKVYTAESFKNKKQLAVTKWIFNFCLRTKNGTKNVCHINLKMYRALTIPMAQSTETNYFLL